MVAAIAVRKDKAPPLPPAPPCWLQDNATDPFPGFAVGPLQVRQLPVFPCFLHSGNFLDRPMAGVQHNLPGTLVDGRIEIFRNFQGLPSFGLMKFKKTI